MNANANVAAASTLGGAAGCELAQLTDGELLASTRRLVGVSNRVLAALLAHLAEVEARGVHRTRACSSLYTYCIYELRFSEDAASRRVCAARLVKRFPLLLDAIANGELHLTGLLMLGPYLTAENQLEVLARAKHRTKKELAKLVRLLDPLPDVPARIEPLGPELAQGVSGNLNPSWRDFVQSMCPRRDLLAGERPRDWANDSFESAGPLGQDELTETPSATEATVESSADALARVESLQPQRYKVQFTAGEEYVTLVERAKALLSHSLPDASLEDIHFRAMQALVATLEKRAYGGPAGGQKRAEAEPAVERESAPWPDASLASTSGDTESARSHENDHGSKDCAAKPRRRGRYIPATERRAVFKRDEGRCSYIDAGGQRCRETSRLEIHHLQAFARGGAHSAANLALRCVAHNALAAEEDFGRPFCERQRDSLSHERFAESTATAHRSD